MMIKTNKFKPHYVNTFFYLTCLIALVCPSISWAHPHPNIVQSFNQGFMHPLTGLDHTLVMLAVGLIASQQEQSPAYLFPLCFLGFMLIGGLVGFMGIALPWIELGILLSVFGFGFLLSLPKAPRRSILIIATMGFALCHGHAHGYEMLTGLNTFQYAGGFLLATLLLHLIGFVLGSLIKRYWNWLFPATGLTILISSFWL